MSESKHSKFWVRTKNFLREYFWCIFLGIALFPLLSYFPTNWKFFLAFCYLVLIIGYQPEHNEPHDPSLDESWNEDEEWP